MSDDSKRGVRSAGLATPSPTAHTAVTNGHASSTNHINNSSPSAPPVPSVPASEPPSGPLSSLRSLLSLVRSRVRSLWPLSHSTTVLFASLAFLWLTLDPHRRPRHLRTMLTFGPSALVNELSHLALPLISLPALYYLYRRLQSSRGEQWKLETAMAAHVLAAISLLTLIAKSIASRSAFRYALLHPGQLTDVAKRAIASEEEQLPSNAVMPAPPAPALSAVMSALTPVTPTAPPSALSSDNAPTQPPSTPTLTPPAVPSTTVWSSDELAAIDSVGQLNAWRCIQAMLPVPALSRWKDGIRVDAGITFHTIRGQKKQQRLKLDVYHPPNSPHSHTTHSLTHSPQTTTPSSTLPLFPLVIYVHGGGWITGDKRWGSLPLLTELAHQGYVVVTINYRLAPYARFPSFLIDIKRAIAYCKTHATQAWHANPTRTFLAGESAGGHLVTLTALTQHTVNYQPGFEDVDTTCIAVIDLYGVHSFVKGKHADRFAQQDGFFQFLHTYVLTHPIATHSSLYHAASPLSQLNILIHSIAPSSTFSNVPYFFCAHGTTDSLVPIEDTWRFFDAIVEMRQKEADSGSSAGGGGGGGGGGEVLDVCVDVTGGSHAFNIAYNARCYALNDAIGVWMRRVIRAVDERDQTAQHEKQRQAGQIAAWRSIIQAEMSNSTDKKPSVYAPGAGNTDVHEVPVRLQSSL